jgi:hypothetical protein
MYGLGLQRTCQLKKASPNMSTLMVMDSYCLLIQKQYTWQLMLNTVWPCKQCKVEVPNSSLAITWTPKLRWYGVRCGSTNGHQKDLCFGTDWSSCSECANHSKLNRQHDWGDLYDHLMSARGNLHFENKCIRNSYSSKTLWGKWLRHDLDFLIM